MEVIREELRSATVTAPTSGQVGCQSQTGGGAKPAVAAAHSKVNPWQRSGETTGQVRPPGAGFSAGSRWQHVSDVFVAWSRSRWVRQPPEFGCSTLVAGVTPRDRAQARCSSGEKQQHCRQHCSADWQPQRWP